MEELENSNVEIADTFIENDDNKSPKKVKQPNLMNKKQKRLIFYIVMISWFILNLAIFYVYVNIRSISMAFQEYSVDKTTGLLQSKFVGLKNFKYVIDQLVTRNKTEYILLTTFLSYGFGLLVGTTLALVFSYYIYKKFMFSEFFRVILFLPSVISGVVMVTLYKTMVDSAYMQVFNKSAGLLDESQPINLRIMMVIIYTLWMGFGSNILMYSGAMSGIDESIVEACELDGCNVVQEFTRITFPLIWPTFTTFIVVGLANLFTNQMSLYTFFERTAPFQTVGYYMYIRTLNSPGLYRLENTNKWEMAYTELSALGLLITAIVLPLTLGVRKLMEKFGPSAV